MSHSCLKSFLSNRRILWLSLRRNSRSFPILRNRCLSSRLYILSGQHIFYNEKFLNFSHGHTKFANLQDLSEDERKIIAGNESDSTELNEFNNMFEIVCKDLLSEDKALSNALHRCSQVFNYNVGCGKKNRGLTVIKAFKMLSSGKVSPEVLRCVHVLGWCVEMLQAFFLVCDDIMDEAHTRRGKLCWYRQPDVGLSAINDSLLLQSGIYKLLHQYFGSSDVYLDLVNQFLDVTRFTVYGQCMDMLYNPPNQQPRFEQFTLENYATVVEYKTSYYSFYLPVVLAMHYVGNYNRQAFASVKVIALKLGLLFQIQDDYLDCFGDPKETGKIGNDIKQGKCTWFAVSFLSQADESAKKEMLENYGKSNSESISKVLKLYNKFSLEEQFKMYEEQLYKEITTSISTLPDKSLQELFHFLLHKIYKRKK